LLALPAGANATAITIVGRRNANDARFIAPPTTSIGEQNLDGEPSRNAGGLQAPTIDDDRTLQSNAIVSSKFTFSFAKPDPHEFVKLRREGLLSARVHCGKTGASGPRRTCSAARGCLFLLLLRGSLINKPEGEDAVSP
jgi:hypothetical protein